MAAFYAPARLLAAAATAALLVPAAAWAGSTVGTHTPFGPKPATAAELFAFVDEQDAVADAPLRFTRSPLLMNATPTAPGWSRPLPGETATTYDPNDLAMGPQVVPLPPALYPGLILLGLTFLKFRKA